MILADAPAALSPSVLAALAAVALVAGFVDAIAGGGGLLTLPALLMAGLPTPVALATNKGQSVFGSGVALARFARSPLLDRPRAFPAFLAGFAGSLLGVELVRFIPRDSLQPLVLALLLAVAVFMIAYRPPTSRPARTRRPWVAALIGGIIGCYDGFFGPGTGTFLILAYFFAYGDALDAASANAKVVNFASNLAAMILFAAHGLIDWHAALPMAVGQSLGGLLGAHATLRHGRALVRLIVILVSLALVTHLAWQLLHKT